MTKTFRQLNKEDQLSLKDIIDAIMLKRSQVEQDSITFSGDLIASQEDSITQSIKHLSAEKPDLLTVTDENGFTILHYLAFSGFTSIIKSLCEEFIIDPTQHSSDETNILHIAAAEGDLELMRLAIEKGCEVDSLKNNELTSIHLAAANGQFESFQELLEKGAKIDSLTKNGKSALHFAAESGNIKIAEICLEKGLDIEARDEKNRSPLDYAAINFHLELVKLIYKKGALNSYNKIGENALFLSEAESKNPKISEETRMRAREVIEFLRSLLPPNRNDDGIAAIKNGATEDLFLFDNLPPNSLIDKKLSRLGNQEIGFWLAKQKESCQKDQTLTSASNLVSNANKSKKSSSRKR